MFPLISDLTLLLLCIVAIVWGIAKLVTRFLHHRYFRLIIAQIEGGTMDSSVPIKDRPGVMIGAWGFRFFESDHDYDIVLHLGADMGISVYSSNPKMQDSLLTPENRAFVIKHLQQHGELDKVFKKYYGMLRNYKVMDIKAVKASGEMADSPRYYIFLLGLLAMQLGCTLSRKHHRWMKANWSSCLFMYERIDQAKKAAFEYQNGKPLDLGSKTLNEAMMSDTSNGIMFNVPNNAIFVSTMRMHLDNEVAKQNGATAHKGVDISNVFANEDSIAMLERAAAEKLQREREGKTTNVADEVGHAPRALPEGTKVYSWGSDAAAMDRIAMHSSQGLSSEPKGAKTIVEMLMKANFT